MTVADQITPRQRALIMLCVLLPGFMVSVDMSIANVALPEIQGGLAIAPDQLSWVLTSYLVAGAIATPLAGALAPRIGIKFLFIVSIACFGATSFACGLASSLPELVFFRTLQGLAGGAIGPLCQTLIYDVNPPERMTRALSLYAGGAMCGVIVAPPLGGFLTDLASWRWIFLVNVPLAIGAVIGLIGTLPTIPRSETRPFDYFGFVLLATALLCLQLFFDRGQGKGWFDSKEIIAEAGIAILSFYMFAVHSSTTKHSFVDMALFRDRNFVTASVMIFVTSVVNVIPTTVIPLFVQNVQGYDVLYTGILLTPRGVGAVLIMLFLGRVADRTDIRVVILIAMLLQAVSAYAFRFITPDWPGNQLMCWSTVAAIGTSMSTLPLNLIAFSTLSPQMRPMGASLYALVRNVSQGLGAALTISYIARSTEANHVRLLERISIYNPIMTGPGMPDSWSATSPLSLKLMSLEVWRQASVIAYANLFTISAIGVFFFLPLLLIVRAPKRKSAPNPVEEAEILEPSAA